MTPVLVYVVIVAVVVLGLVLWAADPVETPADAELAAAEERLRLDEERARRVHEAERARRGRGYRSAMGRRAEDPNVLAPWDKL